MLKRIMEVRNAASVGLLNREQLRAKKHQLNFTDNLQLMKLSQGKSVVGPCSCKPFPIQQSHKLSRNARAFAPNQHFVEKRGGSRSVFRPLTMTTKNFGSRGRVRVYALHIRASMSTSLVKRDRSFSVCFVGLTRFHNKEISLQISREEVLHLDRLSG